MIFEARVAALNDVATACEELAEHYLDDLPKADGGRASDDAANDKPLGPEFQQRIDQLSKTRRALDAEVNKLGELPKAADPDRESFGQLVDDGKAVLARVTGGLVGQHYSASLMQREQQLQTLIKGVLSQSFDTPLSCAASDVLEAAVVESERGVVRLEQSAPADN